MASRLLAWPVLAVLLGGCAAQTSIQSFFAPPQASATPGYAGPFPGMVRFETTGSIGSPTSALAARPPVLRQDTGLASFYHKPQAVSCGGDFNPGEMTAAHRTLPCGTLVKVTNLTNGLRNFVWITDRGPYIDGRIIDLSRAAARDLGMISHGVVPVKLEVVP
jgi:rare lipoprotein A